MLATMCPDIVFARLPVILTCGIVTALLGFILIKIEFHSHPLSVGSHAKKGIGYPMRVLISIVPSYTTQKRHPQEMGTAEIEAFLTHLAVDRHIAASTQNQALSALLFLYKAVLRQEVESVDAVRARKPKRL